MRIKSCAPAAFVFFLVGLLRAQTTTPLPSDASNLTGLTTPVEAQFKDRLVTGSGFFYFIFGPPDPSHPESKWRTVDRMYLVTAKHVVQPKRLQDLVKLTYFFREQAGERVKWLPVEIKGADLGPMLHLPTKDQVDVAVVDITQFMNGPMSNLLQQRAQLLQFNAVNESEFPGTSPIEVQPGDDVIVIGYPSGSFDQFNKLPILKTGLLNTPIGLRYNGLDAFLLDFKYYEGSSGSLIISKPTHFAINKDRRLQFSDGRQYAFIGVYSGESYWNDAGSQRADLGLGWYYYTIEDAIKNPPVTSRTAAPAR